MEATMGSSAAAQAREPFEFTGRGADYFRIWIVNLLLTILTLGIYSAWAKVRRLKYFSNHTRVAGSVFDYHGSPIAILTGRAVALGLLLVYQFATAVPGPLVLATLALIALLLPWMLRNALRFRLHNTRYRGLRFSFRGTLRDAYITFVFYGALSVLSFSLLAPLFHQRLKAYQHGNAWFGATPFGFGAGVGAFFGVYALVGLTLLGGLVLALLLFGGSVMSLATLRDSGAAADPRLIATLAFGLFATVLALSLVVGPLFQARIGNLVWNHTRLGEHRFESRLRVRRLFGIQLVNFVLVALTLGLYIPWAAVRVARYRAECLDLLPASPLDAFVAESRAKVGAVGEETAEMFDLDIGL
jgi:uncharacterized membrane protein YjgN (DUF898 family)